MSEYEAMQLRISNIDCPGLIAKVREDAAGWWELDVIWVPIPARRRGHASTVLEALCSAADRAGVEVRLDAADGLTALPVLTRLYGRFGFSIAGPIRRDVETLVTMRRAPRILQQEVAA